MMIISAMEEVTSVSFFICRALYTPTERPPKYSATNWGCSFSAFLQLIFNQPDEFVIFARASGVEYRGDEHQQGGTVP